MAIDFLANGDQEGEKVGYYLGYSLLITGVERKDLIHQSEIDFSFFITDTWTLSTYVLGNTAQKTWGCLFHKGSCLLSGVRERLGAGLCSLLPRATAGRRLGYSIRGQ